MWTPCFPSSGLLFLWVDFVALVALVSLGWPLCYLDIFKQWGEGRLKFGLRSSRGQMLTIGHHPQKRQSFARRRNACERRVNVLLIWRWPVGKRGQRQKKGYFTIGPFPGPFLMVFVHIAACKSWKQISTLWSWRHEVFPNDFQIPWYCGEEVFFTEIYEVLS